MLPALSPRLQEATLKQLERLGIEVLTGEQVVEATENRLLTKSGKVIDAEIKVWCAGVRGPAFFETLGSLPMTRSCQLEVDATLKVKGEADIYAIGDCAFCLLAADDGPVPPRAQAAYQQACALATTLVNEADGRPPRTFVYKDYGSLISLSYSAVGSLMGNLFGTVMVEGCWRGSPICRSIESTNSPCTACAG